MIDTIQLQPEDVLACVGAGGKTSLCWRVWNELRAGRVRSIFTTTTHIMEPILPPDTALYLSIDPDVSVLSRLMQRVTGLVVAGARLDEESTEIKPNPAAPARPFKLAGLPAARADQLIADLPGVTWLVEADGARGRSLKWPAAHEPAIPARATAVVVLASLDAIDQPLDETTAHRPEQMARHLGIDRGDILSAEHVARVMTDPEGGLKNIPHGARAIAVLNQSRGGSLHPSARPVAQAVLASGRYERVIAASLRAEEPVLEVWLP
ncbi:MAG TPA: selenium cofactor biosynthesis protein YqeC [Anaerolineae bacterium]